MAGASSLVASRLSDFTSRGLRLVETHISWVLVGPERVWKVKKPVDLGFLDFSSLEKRREACEKELVLNRRLAPTTYLEVTPVCVSPDGHLGFGDGGRLVDWAVCMRRMSEADRFDVLTDGGLLTERDLEELARMLARFYESLPTTSDGDRHGSPEAIAQNVSENFRQTHGSIGRYVSEAQLEELIQSQLEFVREHREIFRARVQAGRVKEGHGDLRLEHIYRDGDRLSVLDCIEFNERFRYADVCADLAFLTMELTERGRVDLAERFNYFCAREMNDYDLYSLLNFYEGYRAFVRAKIATLVADAPGVDFEHRQDADERARRLFLLALAAGSRPMATPRLIVVGGRIASGKSTVSEEISRVVEGPVVSTDRTRKYLAGMEPTQAATEAPWEGIYDAGFTARVYGELSRRAETVLRSGRSVVLDGSFRTRASRESIRSLAGRTGSEPVFVECVASMETRRLRARQRARRASTSDGREEIVTALADSFEPVSSEEIGQLEYRRLETESLDRAIEDVRSGRVVTPAEVRTPSPRR